MTDTSWRANMTQGWRAVGGRLDVDSERIRFSPHRFEQTTGGRCFEHRLSDVTSIEVAPRTFAPFSGGMKRRLRLCLRDGTQGLFVVDNPGQVGQSIAHLAASTGGAPTVEL